ncbi:hypothetical protein [Cellulosilyticum sp. I15G10I2]|uniref:hypothetical protein n=1 Tax=Cellulosilyticum sp. I15G10I2 TaxID=1892843 RepID=UPI00085C6D14|nr:hypothetical protein [Cellulosilyticum sp. I15G10I2]
MKIKDWLKYLLYIILILFIITIKVYVGNLSIAYSEQELRVNYCYMVISVLIHVCIGVVLGLEHIIKEIGKEGKWKINLPKLISVGMPSLYFALTYIRIYNGIQFLQNIIVYPVVQFARYVSGSVPLFQIILGYVVITSFYKYSEIIDS